MYWQSSPSCLSNGPPDGCRMSGITAGQSGERPAAMPDACHMSGCCAGRAPYVRHHRRTNHVSVRQPCRTHTACPAVPPDDNPLSGITAGRVSSGTAGRHPSVRHYRWTVRYVSSSSAGRVTYVRRWCQTCFVCPASLLDETACVRPPRCASPDKRRLSVIAGGRSTSRVVRVDDDRNAEGGGDKVEVDDDDEGAWRRGGCGWVG